MSFFAILETQNFEIWDLKVAQIYQKSKFRTSKIAQNDIIGPFEFAKT